MARRTRLKSVPAVGRGGDPVPALQAAKQVIEAWQGQLDPLDEVITKRALQSGDLAARLREVRVGPGGGSGGGGIIEDLPLVTKPLNVRAMGGFGHVVVSYDYPTYRGHALAEIWRATLDDLGQATLVIRDSGVPTVDRDVDSDTTYFYWVRFVNVNGDTGPFSDSVEAQTAKDVEFILERLNEAISESELAQNLQTRLDGIEDNETAIQTQETITQGLSAQYTVKIDNNGGVAGFGLASTASDDTSDGEFSEFYVNVDRFAVLPQGGTPGQDEVVPFAVENNEVVINELVAGRIDVIDGMIESLDAGKLFAPTGEIVDLIVNDGQITNAMIGEFIQSNDYSAGSAGWRVDKDGTAEFNNATFRGTVEVFGGNIDGSTGFSGSTAKDVRAGSRVGFSNSFEPDGEFEEWSTAADNTIAVSTDQFDGTQAALMTYSGSGNPTPTGSTEGVFIEIPASIALAFGGSRALVTVYAKQPSSNASAEFGVAYSTSDAGNSGWNLFTPATTYQAFRFLYDVPEPGAGGTDYLGIWADTSNSGLGVIVDRVSIAVVPRDTDIDSLQTTNGPAQAGADVTGSNTANDVFTGVGKAVAESGADKTSNNTANDTSNVGGTDSGTVRDNAQAGADSASTVDDWTRPTTTLIDGNKIFTGDAYVDTLQIKGQAVTFPAASQISSQRSLANGSWRTLVDETFNCTGAPVMVNMSAVIGAEADVVPNVDTCEDIGVSMDLRLVRDGATIWSANSVVIVNGKVCDGSAGSGTGPIDFNYLVAFPYLDMSPGSGSTNYIFQAQYNITGTPDTHSGHAFRRFMGITEFKR